MAETRVVHFKKEPFDVYIGKPSKWSNPYSYKEGTLAKFMVRDRKEAIEKFEQYLLNNKELMNSIRELKGKTLGCWCKNADGSGPSCHGDILKKYADAPSPLF